jgi:two-component system nitrate/nitrite response regulator NarL
VIRGTVLAISHQPICLDGILAALAAAPGLGLAGSGTCASEAPALAARLRPAVVLIDSGAGEQGLEVVAGVLRACPATRVVVLTAAADVGHAVAALEAGAAGYLGAGTTAGELAAAIRHVLGGETYLSPTLAAAVIAAIRGGAGRDAAAPPSGLTVREQQIAQHLLHGRTNREIAGRLGLQEKTVKHYMTLLLQKYHARNRLELALRLERPEPVSAPWRTAPRPAAYRPASDAA